MRVCIFIVLLGGIPLQAADQAPFQISAELGFANLFQADRLLLFQADLSAAQASIEGQLRIFAPNHAGGMTIYELPVSLAPGSRKRWRALLPPITGDHVRVQVTDRSEGVLTDQQFFGFPVAAESRLLLTVQETTAKRFVFPRKTAENERGGWRTASVTSEFLPENPMAYASVSAILWRSDKPQALNPAQAQALLEWVKVGGLLVIAGGRTVPPNLPSSFQADVRWGEMTSLPLKRFVEGALIPPVRPLTMLAPAQTAGWEKGDAPESSVGILPLTGEQVATELEIGGAKIPALVNKFATRLDIGDVKLITEQAVEGGVIMQLAFDPMDLAAEGFALDHGFWEQLLRLPDPRRSIWAALGWLTSLALDNNHAELAQAADYRVASVERIVWIFGTFFGLAFCLNFWLFRKSRRYEWAWLILIVASVGLFSYNRAYGRVGGFGPTRHIEIARCYGVAGQKTLVSFAHVGLLSPRTRNETVRAKQTHQLLFGADRDQRVIRLVHDKQMFPAQIKAGAFATCSSVAIEELPGDGIAAKWEKSKTQIKVTLTNKTGLSLDNPRFAGQPEGSAVSGGANDLTLTIPNAAFEDLINQAQSSTSQEAPNMYGERYDYSARFGGGIVALPAGWPSPYGGGGIPQAAIEFQFSLSRSVSLSTGSGATDVRARRFVSLAIPIPVEMSSVTVSAPQQSPPTPQSAPSPSQGRRRLRGGSAIIK
ncbi:MAG: hypothetical protein HY360_09985 [Verrucomicrobia bacterium]|nr:hypothetical protein [Verrucomicrobiota bacterium]